MFAGKPQRILLLSGLKIFPNQAGGHLRSGGVAKALARMGHEVCIYSLAGRREDYGHGQEMLYQAIEENLVEEVDLSLSFGLVQTLARRLSLPRLWQYALLRLGMIPSSLRNRLRWADVIICDLPFCPPIPGSWRKKPWLLLSHNLEYRLMAQGKGWDRWLAPVMERIEMVAPLRYQAILACAQEDLDYFRQRAPEPQAVRLVANGIDPLLYTRSDDEGRVLRHSWGLDERDRLIVFSGSRFQPNLDALARLETFCQKEEAFLKANRIKFLILGSMRARPEQNEIMIVTGPVPETFPYFAAADAALNPIESGSGSNVKIFEYLAARLPVLSTRFGVRGTQLQPQIDFIPIQGADLKASLQIYLEKDKAEWKSRAEDVWSRHQDACDMSAIVHREWRALPGGRTLEPRSLLAFSDTHNR